jgi:cytochrome c-type biogenesis protein CcsB
MQRKFFVRTIDVAVLGLVGYVVVVAATNRPAKPQVSEFVKNVDLAPLKQAAIQAVGRISSFDSHARQIVREIAGPAGVDGQDAAFTYLDLMIRPEQYKDRDIIFIKKPIRQRLAQVLHSMNVPGERIEAFLKTGRIAENLIRQPAMLDELARMDQDVIRTAKFVNAVKAAVFLSDPHELSARMAIVAPPGGNEKTPWLSGENVWGLGFLGDGHQHGEPGGIRGLTDEHRAALTGAWNKLVSSWRAEDAAGVNEAVAALAGALAKVEPALYPPTDKLELESWYFRMRAFVWNWITYVLALVPLLIWVIYRWKNALRIGAGIMLVAFAIHTLSLGVRWYLAGRIPNSNMFEAILAATWLGVAGAFITEFLVRKTAMRGLFYLGSGVCAMVAMMCQHFLPTTLRSDIENIMPVLNDLWLYIHTNVIIWSYALIGMAAVTALLYLRYRAGGGDPAVGRGGGAGALILAGAPGKGDSFLRSESPTTAGQVLDAATMVTMELAFVMLWAGLVMGAIWADHSWGRPWGWDPKEVFALCTFLIFLILVHVRFKVRDKGLWTAVLAVIGCAVMLFNWIVINFKISGLHSYA